MKRNNFFWVWSLAAWMLIIAPSAFGLTPAEYSALSDLYSSTGGDNWNDNSGWFNTDVPECQWYGITCDEQERVKEIILEYNNLSGTIPESIGDLSLLERLLLNNNELTGPIPNRIGELTNLQALVLDNNMLNGTIPAVLGNLGNLVYLSLWENALTGTVPPELGNLSNLFVLYLCCNELTGTIPPELGNLAQLQAFHIQQNNISGTLPPSIGNLTQLQELLLYENDLDGTLPSEIGNLTSLTLLHIDNNGFDGPVPDSLMNLTALADNGNDFRYNSLYTANEELRLFMNQKQIDGDWMSSQNLPTGGGAIPAIDLYGAAAYTYTTSEGTVLAIEIRVIDHDGIAPDGSSHQVTVTQPNGSVITLEKPSIESETSAFYSRYWGVPQNGLYTFTVTDPEGNTATATDTLEINILSPPDGNSVSYPNGENTTPTFTWNSVPGVSRYRVRIYNSDRSTAWRGNVEGQTRYTVPPGVLQPNTEYTYRLEARDSHPGLDIDNFSKTPASNQDNFPFSTGAESVDPYISLENIGVQTVANPKKGTYYNFWIKVHDAQGVPGDIGSVSVTFPGGEQIPLYYDPASDNGSTWGIYKTHSFLPIQSGTYTFTVADREGNTVSVLEELNADPIGYPPEETILPAHGSVIDGTAVNFDWEDVEGAAFYQIEIYDKDRKRIFDFRTTESQYPLPPGFLTQNTLYRYQIKTRREFFDQNVDNLSLSTVDSYSMSSFMTGGQSGGSQSPGVTLDIYGVAMWKDLQVSKYVLDFIVNVGDGDGVPGNIRSVRVTYPDGITTLELFFLEELNSAEGTYWRHEYFESLDLIQNGTYTFTVTDFDGNTAQITDEFVKNELPAPTNMIPAQNATLSIQNRLIDWDDVSGAAVYRVRVYDGWNRQIHESGFVSQSSYAIPEGVLTLDSIYNYRVDAFREQLPDAETDNYSKSSTWPHAQNHFMVVQVQEPPPPNNPPSAPVITGPPNETVDPDGAVTLNTGAFTDPDGDTHQRTHWMVRRADMPVNAEENIVIADISDTDLTAHTVSGLTPGLKYIWMAGYEDAGGQIGWSSGSTFKVGSSTPDANVNVPPGETAADFAMVSVVQWPDNPAAGSVLGTELGGIYDTHQYRIGTYDPMKNGGEYREYGDNLVIEPGKAYWIFARSGMGITVNGVPVSTTLDIEVPLAYNTVTSEGWNMIAPPNAKSYNWADVEVVEYDSEGRILFGPEPVRELAEGNPFIDRRLWRWANGVYASDAQVMQPYAGYWVQALRPNISLRFPAGVTVQRTDPDTLLAGMSKKAGRWLERLLPLPSLAVADTGDSPPPPMSGFTGEPVEISGDDSSSGGGTCFISECGR